MTKRDPIDEIYNRLVKKAEQDGIISREEQNLLNRVKMTTMKFKQYYEKAKEDEIIDADESAQLEQWKKDVLLQAWDEADKDQEIQKDEAALLNLLLRLVKNLDLQEY
ncbi:MAG: hypothetical protein INQ03_16285 [Candidatus Heimdallarchaeota archaeon]|nr:hypothetical protein [Candidatus Heimdallarchaeota archaeon]